ncbi:MAG: NfeD family protein, partial [Candidatus Cloacimonetes bacterium]|nr:NfeD family protein [Candidatus Cloacimonadota bacterium]
MELWMIWVGAGIICLIIEIFTPGFLFMSFGISAIITGLSSLFIHPVYWQIFLFAIFSILLFINLRKISDRLISKANKPTNVSALIGKTGIVMQDILKDGKGYVKIGGEGWAAIADDNELLSEKIKVVVVAIDGNKVVVKKA